MMMSILGFTFEKLKKSSFQIIIPTFFNKTLGDFLLESFKKCLKRYCNMSGSLNYYLRILETRKTNKRLNRQEIQQNKNA